MSEGKHILITRENNNIADGRMILNQEDPKAKPYLICFQMRFTKSNKYLNETEVEESCQAIIDHIVPHYSKQFDIILVMITNRPFAKGKYWIPCSNYIYSHLKTN